MIVSIIAFSLYVSRYVRLLQTGLSSLSDNIQGLPNAYTSLTGLSSLTADLFDLSKSLPNTYASLCGF